MLRKIIYNFYLSSLISCAVVHDNGTKEFYSLRALSELSKSSIENGDSVSDDTSPNETDSEELPSETFKVNFIDTESESLNVNSNSNGESPSIVEYNSELYAIWKEGFRIYIKKYNGNNTWSLETSLDYNRGKDTNRPKIITYNSKLYAIWSEGNSSDIFQIYVKEFDGSSWTFKDSGIGEENGLNYNSAKNAINPSVAIHEGRLYVSWSEEDTIPGNKLIRIAFYDGSSWTQNIDTNSLFENTFSPNDHVANYSSLISFQGKLYVIWNQGYRTIDDISKFIIYSKVLDGGVWKNLYSIPEIGLNYNLNILASAGEIKFYEYNNTLFSSWSESNGTYNEIYLSKFNGDINSPSWSFIISSTGLYGLNVNSTYYASNINLSVWNEGLYLIWNECEASTFTNYQIRMSKMFQKNNGSYVVKPVDGGGSSGLNADPSQNAVEPFLYNFRGNLYASWEEEGNAFNSRQTRVGILLKVE